jgi:hypothetical protein
MASDNLLLILAAGAVGFGLWKRSQRVVLVPAPIGPINDGATPGNPGIVETRYPIAPKPRPVPTTILPLRSEAAIRGGVRTWAIPNDLTNVDKLTAYFRQMAAIAMGSVMSTEYYWPWMADELVKVGAPARNVALAQMMARNLGPKA